MTALQLHPEILTREGGKRFAVIPYDEFLKLEEMLEDAQDLLDLNEAIEEHKGAVGVPLDDILKKYKVNQQP